MKKLISVVLFLLLIININAQDNHPIIGTWQLSTVEVDGETKDGFQAVWIFENEGVFKAARSVSGEVIPVGTWKCDKERKVLIMKSKIDKDFNGEAKVLKLEKNILSYKKDDAILSFTKTEMAKPDTTPIPELNFSYKDFLDEDGGDKYLEDGTKLPWTIDQVYVEMKDIKEIVYHIDHFETNKGKTDSWTNSYKTEFLSDNELSIREYSYFQKDYIEDYDVFPLNDETDGQMIFFPQDEPEYFRVVGEEDFKTDLGVFKCTIVEGIGDSDKKLKYWMINEKPGIYAKIIFSKTEGNPFDYTNVYELKEIK